MRFADRDNQLVDALRAAIVVELTKGKPHVDRVAAHLGMSTRSLQRQIGLRGTTFSLLVRDVRREAAAEMLSRTQIPLSAIAVSLGYSEPSSFSRAFRRWFGVTPREYRDASGGPWTGQRHVPPGTGPAPRLIRTVARVGKGR